MRSNIEDNISLIQRQTNMPIHEIKAKLEHHNNDYLKVIHEYFGVKDSKKDNANANANANVENVNQEIYKQLRNKLGYISNS